MTKAEAGQIGGRRTVERHGREHMAAIGRKGFAALATFKNGGRAGAFALLTSRGKMAPRRPIIELSPEQARELCLAVGLDDDLPW